MKYRLGYDYIFQADKSFIYKGYKIKTLSAYILFHVYNQYGKEIIFYGTNAQENQIRLKDGSLHYLSEFLYSTISDGKIHIALKVGMLEQFDGTITIEIKRYSKDALIDGNIIQIYTEKEEFDSIFIRYRRDIVGEGKKMPNHYCSYYSELAA